MLGIGKKSALGQSDQQQMPEYNFPEGSKAKLVVILEKESLLSKAGGRGGTFSLFMADRVNIQIDGEKVQKLVRQKPDVPFEFEIKPGPHMIEFFDPNAKSKSHFTLASIVGLTAGIASGSLGNAIDGYVSGFRPQVEGSVVRTFLNPDDVFTVSVKCTRKGEIEIKIIE